MAKFDSTGDKVFLAIDYVLLALLAAITIYPFWQQVVISISPEGEALKAGMHLFTIHPDFLAYKRVFHSSEILHGFYYTVQRVVIGTTMNVFITALTAYPLSKKKLPLNRVFTLMILFAMIFEGGLIPNYILINKLGLTNTVWALTIPQAFAGYYIIITRNFFRTTIPDSIEESARIDGAPDFKIWWRIYLPLSLPVIATVALWDAVRHWNAYFDALIYIHDRSKYVLQVILRRILLENQLDEFTQSSTAALIMDKQKPTDESVKAAILVVSTLPILMTYPFLQKYFVKGITLGSVKE